MFSLVCSVIHLQTGRALSVRKPAFRQSLKREKQPAHPLKRQKKMIPSGIIGLPEKSGGNKTECVKAFVFTKIRGILRGRLCRPDDSQPITGKRKRPAIVTKT
ncbi:hypothetical protein [Angelakisella massiliensis]|uniref:hypothetical protein n=1 Tax=Angelakisella massiliensis TaxID=1871018 RepID=UPI0024B0A365|nr:hypothetical protein [Angelakisella massiliensis]